MTDAHSPETATAAHRYAAVLLAGCALLFVLFLAAYPACMRPLLARLDMSVGEVLMEEAMRLEEAGALANAEERYTMAIASRFAGEANRVFALKRLGTLLWQRGEATKARPYLKEAAEGPDAPISGYLPYCHTLLAVEDFGAARACAKRWLGAAQAAGDTGEEARACHAAGRAALGLGDEAGAIAHFERGDALAPGGTNASELAMLFYGQKDYPKALRYVSSYLESGATGGRARYARDIHRAIQAKMDAAKKKETPPAAAQK